MMGRKKVLVLSILVKRNGRCDEEGGVFLNGAKRIMESLRKV